MTLRLLVISLCLFSGIFASRAQTPHEMAEKALGELDRVLDRRSEYISQRQNAIDSLIEVWKQHPDDGCTLLKIADRYTSFNNDSALHYLRIGKKRYAGTTAGQEFRWKYASLLPLAGFYETAEKEFYSIRPDEIAKWQQASYLAAGTQMHSYIAASFRNYPEIVAAHTDSMTVLQRRLLDILPTDGNQYKFLLGEYYFMQGAHDRARPLLEETVDSEPVSSNLRARAAHHLSSIARADSIADLHIYYLALSATADVVSATRETISLQELGSACRDTNIRRAHSYLSNAMANAVECGASVRMIDTSQARHPASSSQRDAQDGPAAGLSAQRKPNQRSVHIAVPTPVFHLHGQAESVLQDCHSQTCRRASRRIVPHDKVGQVCRRTEP